MKKTTHKPITEDRILQLSNDLSEGIKRGTVAEWREVAKYYRYRHDNELKKWESIQPSMSALVCGIMLYQYSTCEIKKWMATHYPQPKIK